MDRSGRARSLFMAGQSAASAARCRSTCAATTGTPFYRLQTEAVLVLVVLSLLSWGCPVQAIVHTFALDERTVATWLQRAGQHGQGVHAHLIQQGQVDLQHVQADELWIKPLRPRPCAVGARATKPARPTSHATMGCLVILLMLILATMLAGPVGFLVAIIVILGWAVVTGSLHLLWALLLLPFKLLERMLGDR